MGNNSIKKCIVKVLKNVQWTTCLSTKVLLVITVMPLLFITGQWKHDTTIKMVTDTQHRNCLGHVNNLNSTCVFLILAVKLQ